jgi:hypothetical protein
MMESKFLMSKKSTSKGMFIQAPKEALLVFSRPYLKTRIKVKGLRLKDLYDLFWILNPLCPTPHALCPHLYIGLPPLDEIDMVLKKWTRPDWAYFLRQSQPPLTWSRGPGFPC